MTEEVYLSTWCAALTFSFLFKKGLNPYITYNVKGSSDFTIVDGYLFMTKDLPEATLRLEVSLQI